MSKKYTDVNFAKSREWTSKEEFAAAYREHMKQKYGSFITILAWFFIQAAIEKLWRELFNANES